jgi:hypothetical protein
MKVKKLEWEENFSETYQESSNQQFIIIYPHQNIFTCKKQEKYMSLLRSWGGLKAEKALGKYETLKEAQEACQKHYEEFILSQIE